MRIYRYIICLILSICSCTESEKSTESKKILEVSVASSEGVRPEVSVRLNSSSEQKVNLVEVPARVKSFLENSSFEKHQIDLVISEKWIAAKLSVTDFEKIGIKVRKEKIVSSHLSIDGGEVIDPFED